MKAFTPLMKLCIMAVTIALAAMLIISAAPLVMGGINVEKEQDINIEMDGADLHISGKYVVESSVNRDISDLELEAYLKNKEGQTMTLIKVPTTTISKGQKVVIDLEQRIPIAELAVFFIVDNMDNGTPGIVLPINFHIAGSYSNHLAGINMNLVYEYVVSETGSFNIDPSATEHTGDGDLSKAKLDITGVDDNLKALIPAGGASFEVTIGGKTLTLGIDESGDDISLVLETGDLDNDSISEVIHDILDAVSSGSDEPITFEFNGESHTFNPSDIDTEEAQKYMDQVEGVVNSLDVFLDKFNSMSGGA